MTSEVIKIIPMTTLLSDMLELSRLGWCIVGYKNDMVVLKFKRGKRMTIKYKSFTDDKEKMKDFCILSKIEFLKSYSYLTELEYDLTQQEVEND